MHEFDENRINLLGLPGSLRADSWNRRLLQAAQALAGPARAFTVYEHLAEIPLFSEDVEGAGVPQSVRRLADALAAADGLLIATPEYNQSFPGVLKNAIDWLSRSDALADKPVALVGATVGPWGTRLAQAGLRQVLAACEARVMPAPMLFVPSVAGKFDAHGHLADAATREALARLLDSFSRWIRLAGPMNQPGQIMSG